jgi:hypothetical protein
MALATIGQIKGLFTNGDLTDRSVRIEKRKCFTLQDYTYDCHRSLDKSGVPFGNTVPSILQFTIRIPNPDDCKEFYKQIKSNDGLTCSFIFNAGFDEMKLLNSYDSAMTVRGFIVEVTEDYNSDVNEQMKLTLRILLNRITYIGRDVEKVLLITQ